MGDAEYDAKKSEGGFEGVMRGHGWMREVLGYRDAQI